jgi:hypothetical protein
MKISISEEGVVELNTDASIDAVADANNIALKNGNPPAFIISDDGRTAQIHPGLFKILKENPHLIRRALSMLEVPDDEIY